MNDNRLSGVGVEEPKTDEPWMNHIREMTFDELHEQSKRNMAQFDWDRLGNRTRMIVQKTLDPYYSNEIARPRRGRY